MKLLVLALFATFLILSGPATAAGAASFALNESPAPVPEISFVDSAGTQRSLADFRGRFVLLNIWATWCVPCRTEMPTLDRLQAELGGPVFEVVALSIDRNGAAVVQKFFDEVGIQNLAVFVDTSSQAAFSLGTVGLPATLLIDRNGQEIGRLVGPAEWDAPEMVVFLRSVITGPAGPAQTP